MAIKGAATILSCGVVVVRQTASGWLTVMLRAYNHWDFPKGLCEVGEESGLSKLTFAWGERFTETGPYQRGKVARYYLAQTSQEEIVMGISPDLGRPEHHEYRWVSFDTAHDLASPRVRGVVQWARQVVGG